MKKNFLIAAFFCFLLPLNFVENGYAFKPVNEKRYLSLKEGIKKEWMDLLPQGIKEVYSQARLDQVNQWLFKLTEAMEGKSFVRYQGTLKEGEPFRFYLKHLHKKLTDENKDGLLVVQIASFLSTLDQEKRWEDSGLLLQSMELKQLTVSSFHSRTTQKGLWLGSLDIENFYLSIVWRFYSNGSSKDYVDVPVDILLKNQEDVPLSLRNLPGVMFEIFFPSLWDQDRDFFLFELVEKEKMLQKEKLKTSFFIEDVLKKYPLCWNEDSPFLKSPAQIFFMEWKKSVYPSKKEGSFLNGLFSCVRSIFPIGNEGMSGHGTEFLYDALFNAFPDFIYHAFYKELHLRYARFEKANDQKREEQKIKENVQYYLRFLKAKDYLILKPIEDSIYQNVQKLKKQDQKLQNYLLVKKVLQPSMMTEDFRKWASYLIALIDFQKKELADLSQSTFFLENLKEEVKTRSQSYPHLLQQFQQSKDYLQKLHFFKEWITFLSATFDAQIQWQIQKERGTAEEKKARETLLKKAAQQWYNILSDQDMMTAQNKDVLYQKLHLVFKNADDSLHHLENAFLTWGKDILIPFVVELNLKRQTKNLLADQILVWINSFLVASFWGFLEEGVVLDSISVEDLKKTIGDFAQQLPLIPVPSVPLESIAQNVPLPMVDFFKKRAIAPLQSTATLPSHAKDGLMDAFSWEELNIMMQSHFDADFFHIEGLFCLKKGQWILNPPDKEKTFFQRWFQPVFGVQSSTQAPVVSALVSPDGKKYSMQVEAKKMGLKAHNWIARFYLLWITFSFDVKVTFFSGDLTETSFVPVPDFEVIIDAHSKIGNMFHHLKSAIRSSVILFIKDHLKGCAVREREGISFRPHHLNIHAEGIQILFSPKDHSIL